MRSAAIKSGKLKPLGNLSRGLWQSELLDIPLLIRHEVAYHWHLYGGPYLAFFLNGYSETSG